MNYYEHHLGDYLRDTAHLSMLEDGAYRRLMDAYYIREQPLPSELRDVYRLVRASSKQDREAVDVVLREFFQHTDAGWQHKRCASEIARFQDKQAKARRSAETRWNAKRAECEGNANASHDSMRTHCEGNAPRARPQSPDTSLTPHSPPRGAGKVAEFPPGFEEFWLAYPRRLAKQDAAKAFAKLRADDALLRRILASLEVAKASPDWLKDGGRFIPHAATWLNGKRWEDELSPVEAPAWEGAK